MSRSRVWIATLPIDEAAALAIDILPRDTLPSQQQQRLSSMASASARRQTHAGLWLLGKLLSAAGESRDKLATLGYAGDGRPTLADGPSFNISHSRDLVACALSYELTLGLDIETRDQRIPPRIARETSDDERAATAAVPSAFFDFWCAREATIKASGRVGLGRLKRVRLAPGCARVDDEKWHLLPLHLAPGYAACLASPATIAPCEISVVRHYLPA
ncbi:4'-phosphopantetheinyl transferase superfamily protein [Salinisphaera sp. USBA-960]|uniref:4'-phosphopantetheinyl transferase family protein n=1 Tax=Salinisphaera orenii TaxID=856731 RepID=UPI0013A63EF0|nr:4'-phosphopantetheinyl transferase superfamily protein [Salifodinibacter halophilus]NNC26277.1 4'-phosphopantetheinyl transferase superfamily protein [Salifodinibacter halophilus]